jgi:very-short-patch-repair endonuclease
MIKICQHCKNFFDVSDKPKGWIANHSRWCKENPKLQEYKEKSRIISVKNMNNARLSSGRFNQFSVARLECSEVPVSPNKGKNINSGKPHSEETKLKISESRKLYLKENPDKHPWKNNKKFISAPCEIFKEYLRSRQIEFEEEYQALSDRFFSIDIAFPSLKIGIEINGEQHYNRDGTLKEYYRNRHDLIESYGWKLHEIHYSICYKKDEIERIINSISA